MERKIARVQFPAKMPTLKNVAAYARVSSGKDAMLHSLSAQVSYYKELISKQKGWKFCGVYADEALTGTKDNREQFCLLLEACRRGEIDMVLTKSISRFARNTVTLLETVRELKLLNVDVYFEEQNIHSISPDGELLLTILASYAQEESLSASENRKWQIRKDFEKGKIGSITIFGYRRNADGVLEIEPDEAEIVRMIFADYLSGMGGRMISNKINEMGVRTRQGNLWTSPRIKEILQNEKYAGKMLLQKYYRNNHIEKRKVTNHGELQRYLIDDAHEAIIDMETFERAQQEIQRRQMYNYGNARKRYPLSGRIICAGCGKHYQHKNYPQGAVWLCSTYARRGKKYCPTAKQLSEKALYAAMEGIGQVSTITVKGNLLIFQLENGESITREWQNPLRSESWTEEMRQQARERSQHGKKGHNHSGVDQSADTDAGDSEGQA